MTTGRRSGPEAVVPTDTVPKESALASRLSNVPDITVETIVGTLPHLPHAIPAVYRDGANDGDVRVIWPSPTDNSQVISPGSYSVTGTVPGTSFAPKATVIVKVPVGTMTPPDRLAEFVAGLPEPTTIVTLRNTGHFFEGREEDLADTVGTFLRQVLEA